MTPGAPHPPSPLEIDRHVARTSDGWGLALKRTLAPERFSSRRRPVLIIPGYGMNSFIFGFHPRGTSMERCLAEAGFEVWSADLRLSGRSRPLFGDDTGRPPGPSIATYAGIDLPALVETVLAGSRTHAPRLDLIGCSLGGSIAYAHLALRPDTPVHALCTVSAPFRFTTIHPAVRAAFSSTWLAERLVIRGVRPLARAGSGLIRRVPRLLSVYMNAAHIDLSRIDEMLETVEDPHPAVNHDIARWLRHRDLVVGGVNVTAAMARESRPLLLVVPNRDGIVPESSNLAALDAWGGHDKHVLRVGDTEEWYAHADLFVGDEAPRLVFAPIADWLTAHEGGTYLTG